MGYVAVEEIVDDATKELTRLEGQLAELEQLAESGEYEKDKIIKSIDVLREIISEQALTNTNIMMLIDKVVVRETEELGQ